MMPAFQRGDILFLTNYNDPIRVGEIVVFKIKDREIPIVHRVLRVHEKEDGEVIFIFSYYFIYSLEIYFHNLFLIKLYRLKY